MGTLPEIIGTGVLLLFVSPEKEAKEGIDL